MRIGITYLYAISRYGYPHSVDDSLNSLAEVRRLGFRYLEMEGLGAEHLQALYARRHELLDALGDHGVHVHNFCVVDSDMVSLDYEVRRPALDRFRLGAEIVQMIGAETLHLASYAPPVEYAGARPYQLSSGDGYQFANTTRVRLPDAFRWEDVWSALVEGCQVCADIAAEYGRTVLMEPRVGETICSVDSLLRLIADVDRPNFKANFDTGHFSAQRENVVLALAKLRGRFANVHVSDNDPVSPDHLPIGDGLIDWPEFFDTLRRFGYDGYLGLDLGPSPRLADDYRRSVDTIRRIASDAGVAIEI